MKWQRRSEQAVLEWHQNSCSYHPVRQDWATKNRTSRMYKQVELRIMDGSMQSTPATTRAGGSHTRYTASCYPFSVPSNGSDSRCIVFRRYLDEWEYFRINITACMSKASISTSTIAPQFFFVECVFSFVQATLLGSLWRDMCWITSYCSSIECLSLWFTVR